MTMNTSMMNTTMNTSMMNTTAMNTTTNIGVSEFQGTEAESLMNKEKI